MNKTSPTPIPRNPVPGIIYGIIWLVIGVVLGILLLSYSNTPDELSNVYGQRTLGFIVFTPFIALAASIFCFVRAAAASAPYKRYVASTSLQQRQKNEAAQWKNADRIGGLIAFTVIAFLGLFALLIVFVMNYANISDNVRSLTSFVGILLIIGLGAGSLLRLVIRIRNSTKQQ